MSNSERAPPPPPDPRPHLNLVFIGHVDAGKSTIAGTIMFLTGNIDQRLIERYKREAKSQGRASWYMAYVMDTSDEERAKGKTVEVGMAHFETAGRRFTVLDAPGHANYVPNMIAGATQADVAILVISARKNEFEQGFERGGQTREHATLARTLGVSSLIVLVNKMDTCDWAQSRFDQILKGLRPFLRSIGFNRNVTWVCCSGLNGDNVAERVPNAGLNWMTEKRCLLEVINDLAIGDRYPDAPLRMPIVDKYMNLGTWVRGKIEQGTIKTSERISVQAGAISAVVDTITIANQAVSFASVGESVAIRLRHCDIGSVRRGDVISSQVSPVPSVREFVAHVVILDLLPGKPIITVGYSCVLHIHTAVEDCTVQRLAAWTKTLGCSKPKRLRFARSGSVVIMRIRTERKMCVQAYDEMKQLGRFTLRDEGKTIAIGKILKVV